MNKSIASAQKSKTRFRFVPMKVSAAAGIEALVFLLVLLFIYAAISKLQDYQEFKLQLGKSPYLTGISSFIVWLIPAIEIITSVFLTFKKTRLLGFYLSLFLMTMFSVYIVAILKFSYYIPCSCGGILSQMDWNTHFWFNLIFVTISIGGILLESKRIRKTYYQK